MPRPPLPSHWFHILLALADHDLHGLAITKEVYERTGGQVQLWPGMLYGALRKMEDAGFVREIAPPKGFTVAGGRPRLYRLTALGRQVTAEEAQRLADLVDVARAKRLIRRPGTT